MAQSNVDAARKHFYASERWGYIISRKKLTVSVGAKTICVMDYSEASEALARLIVAAPRLRLALAAAERAIEDATDIMHYEDGQCQTHLESREIEDCYTTLVSVMVQIDEALRASANGDAQ
jgi:hypothetical protein